MPRDITQAEIPLSGRTVLVVGAASGIGRATAERFLRAGSLVILAARHPERCGDLQALAPEGRARLLRLDLTDAGTFDGARAALAGADQPVVVITAGILRAGALEDLGDAELRAVLETNLVGPLVLIRRLLPELRRSGGTVIVTTSLSGLAGLPGDVAYAASKWGLEGAMEALRHEVDRFGIRVALVEFGLVNTALFDHDLAHPVTPDSPYGPLSVWQRESLRRRIGSGMDPGEVADAILRIACVDEGQLRYPVGAVAERVVGTLLGQDAATRDAFLRNVAGTDWWSDGQDPPEP